MTILGSWKASLQNGCFQSPSRKDRPADGSCLFPDNKGAQWYLELVGHRFGKAPWSYWGKLPPNAQANYGSYGCFESLEMFLVEWMTSLPLSLPLSYQKREAEECGFTLSSEVGTKDIIELSCSCLTFDSIFCRWTRSGPCFGLKWYRIHFLHRNIFWSFHLSSSPSS